VQIFLADSGTFILLDGYFLRRKSPCEYYKQIIPLIIFFLLTLTKNAALDLFLAKKNLLFNLIK